MQASIGYGKGTQADTRFRNPTGRVVNPLDKRIDSARVRIETQGDPIRFLMDVMKGVSFSSGPGGKVKLWPDMDQRMKAAIILVNKIVPDVKSTEAADQSGKGDGDEHADRGTVVSRLINRLTILAEVTRETSIPGDVIEIGASSHPVPLAVVGEAEPVAARVRKQRRTVADVAPPRRARVRKDKNGSGVGQEPGGDEA